MKYRCFKYSGSKLYLVDMFNKLEKYANKSIYIEPFVGSGSIYINTKNKYNKYVINDINPYVCLIWQTFKNIEYEKINFYKNNIFLKFGNIKEDKKAYYDFRDFYNNEKHEDDAKGIYTYLLMNSCINSMFRIGPNGMNQSYGNRLYVLNENSFNHIKEKLSNTEIINKDYYEILIDKENLIYYIDPPYYMTPSPGYLKIFDINEHKKLINILKNFKKSKYIYSDVLTEFNNELHYKLEIGKFPNISPNRKNNSLERTEYLFSNINFSDIDFSKNSSYKLF